MGSSAASACCCPVSGCGSVGGLLCLQGRLPGAPASWAHQRPAATAAAGCGTGVLPPPDGPTPLLLPRRDLLPLWFAAAAGAHISHTHIVSAWTDSTSWLEGGEFQMGHVPPSQPLVRAGASAKRTADHNGRLPPAPGRRALWHRLPAHLPACLPNPNQPCLPPHPPRRSGSWRAAWRARCRARWWRRWSG